MELQRTLLFAALAMVIFLLWQAWQQQYGPAPQVPAQQAQPVGPAPSAEVPSVAAQAPVATQPGATAFTVMRREASSTARARVRALIAPLLAA